MTSAAGCSSGPGELRRRVEEHDWYHTIDLPGGVVTPGLFDHRKVVGRLPIPESLAGLRCLDAASADGFFAFELARRGAAEVVSLDLADASRQDWQRRPADEVKATRGTGRAASAFELVREALGLDVQRVDRSLYDLASDDLGTFDFVFMGNILLHLADPARALRALRSVMVPDGTLLSYEAVSMPMTLLRPRTPTAQLWHEDHPQWWTPNMAGHRRLLHAGGWDVVRTGGPLFQPFGARMPAWPPRVPRRPRELVFWACTRRVGGATAWALARPAPE
ncbi:MAG: methyltransferase domain-containing protein [Acidimicrobiales bacterium]|nr:methyltransferase domain-containing protein [Acidimicrobiales bacterium]